VLGARHFTHSLLERLAFSESQESGREQVAAWGKHTSWVRSENDKGQVSWSTDQRGQALSRTQRLAMTEAVNALRNSRAAALHHKTNNTAPSSALTSEQTRAPKELGYQGPADEH
jgi:hypothetical protein